MAGNQKVIVAVVLVIVAVVAVYFGFFRRGGGYQPVLQTQPGAQTAPQPGAAEAGALPLPPKGGGR